MTDFHAAVVQFQAGNLQQAEAILKSLPGNADTLFLLGLINIRKGSIADAASFFEQAIAKKPDAHDFHAQLGMARAQLKQLEKAIASFRKAADLRPDIAQLHNNLGTALKDNEQFDEAIAAFENAVRLKPDYALAHNNLGNVLLMQGKPQAAAQCFRQALALNPNFIDAGINLGDALEAQGLLSDAEAGYLAVLARDPSNLRAYNNLSNVYRTQGSLDKSLAVCRRALEIDPDNAEAHSNLGFTYFNQRKLSEAVDSFSRAVALKPDLAVAHHNLGAALSGLGRYEEALGAIRKALALQPDYSEANSTLLFVCQFSRKLTQSEVFEEHRRYAERFEEPFKKNWHRHENTRVAAKRLRIGYVSADLRSHAVAAFIEPVFTAHDATQFEIFCYFNHAQPDSVSERLRSHVEHWIACVGMNDAELAERIRADGIDILIDLSGHTAGNRLPVFARKPAPVQITYLGYPGTTGLSAVDYRITDAYADPADADPCYSEKLLRLPDSLCCYRPLPNMPEIAPLPALTNGYVTFGSFNNSNKIDEHSIALWAQILKGLPSSRLLMLTVPEGERREKIALQFEHEGVARERIDFHGGMPAREFHTMLGKADIALDPLLVTGGTTTCETLWMGVPVVVLKGRRFIHRVGYSFLCSAGLPQYAAETPEDYVRVALEAAADLPALAKLREQARARLAVSPLMDQARFVRHFENALRNAWQAWCEPATRQMK